jgi:hypothetical protein
MNTSRNIGHVTDADKMKVKNIFCSEYELVTSSPQSRDFDSILKEVDVNIVVVALTTVCILLIVSITACVLVKKRRRRSSIPTSHAPHPSHPPHPALSLQGSLPPPYATLPQEGFSGADYRPTPANLYEVPVNRAPMAPLKVPVFKVNSLPMKYRTVGQGELISGGATVRQTMLRNNITNY